MDGYRDAVTAVSLDNSATKCIGPPIVDERPEKSIVSDQVLGCASGAGRLRRSAMNWSNSALSLAMRSRARKS
jgi:hypothetical protein